MQLPANGPLTQTQGQPVKPAVGQGRQPLASRDGGAAPQQAEVRPAKQAAPEATRQIVNTVEFDRNAPRGTYLNIII